MAKMAKKAKKQETPNKTKTYALFGDDKFENINETSDTSFSKKSLSVFEFVDSIFKPGKNIEDVLLPYELGRFYFILNRFMSIGFPLQASYLNDIGINSIDVVKFWAKFLRAKYKKTPVFFYTKTKKGTEKYIPDETIKREYCRINNIDSKTFKDALSFFPDELKKELDDLDNFLKKYG